MAIYLDARTSDQELMRSVPIAMMDAARFDARSTRTELLNKRQADLLSAEESGSAIPQERLARNLTEAQTERYYYRPFDRRWLYWESQTKLLDEKREDYRQSHVPGQFAIVSAQSNRRAYDPPTVTSTLTSLHVVEKGSSIIPLQHRVETLPGVSEVRNNISDRALARFTGDNGASDLFFHALATMHTPRYRTENAGALLGDWPCIPLPATAELLAHSATLGHRLADLLAPESSPDLGVQWSFLARLVLPSRSDLTENLKLTAGWGSRGQGPTVMPGRGKLTAREWTRAERDKLDILAPSQFLSIEQSLALLGETCIDVHLNDQTLWSAVPINVWNYTLGGYQVLKKWLSYREYPLLGRPLHPEEAAWFAQVVRRISAILLLGPSLNASYAALLPNASGLPISRADE